VIGVMHADMQHDEAILPGLWKAVARGECDLAVGSRLCKAAARGEWDQKRRSITRGATWLARLVLKTHASPCGDQQVGGLSQAFGGITSGFSMNTMLSGITANRIFFELSTVSNGKVTGFWKSGSARAPMLSNSFTVARAGPDWI
jgi:hypothetical protein